MVVKFRGWLRRPRLLGLAAAAAVPVLYAVWVRPRLATWGANRDEITGAYPGDELIPDAATSRQWPWMAT